jgi:serine/threonine-protein kinase
MGEVYRGRDTRFSRDVALKVLPQAFAGDVERRRRFEREARLLASLNHPAIVAFHGLEETDGHLCLVMELVEGATLVSLQKGPFPLSEALGLAHQIAEGLEAAHERGVLHRDLKPSNIKVTPEGRVKLLDFGLAQALHPLDAREATLETTATADTTGQGAALGTAPYMSPEQARGEVLNRRTDIWAFGCVLYEMLSGRRAFPGPTYAETLAAILEREPDWQALPAATPPSIRRLLRRCLQKDKARRLHDIADARLEIEEAQLELGSGAGVVAAAPLGTRRRRIWLWMAGLLAAAVASGLIAFPRMPLTSQKRLTLVPPPRTRLPDREIPVQLLAVSPDGTRVAFVGKMEGEADRLYLQTANEIEARPLPETERAHTPFFSHDGRWLAFQQGRQIRRLRLDSAEAPVVVADIPKEGDLRGASWGPDSMIVFSPGPFEGLWRVSADGGRPELLTSPDTRQDETSHRWPQVLPNGRQVVFTIAHGLPIRRRPDIGILSSKHGGGTSSLKGLGTRDTRPPVTSYTRGWEHFSRRRWISRTVRPQDLQPPSYATST